MAILLLGYGYWEQQGFFRPAYEEIQDKWYQDEAFMNEVEAAAGDGAMIFTLPYMKNFENGSLNNMWDYTLLRGPLHSKTRNSPTARATARRMTSGTARRASWSRTPWWPSCAHRV